MSFQFNGLSGSNVTISGSVSIPTLSSTQTIVCVNQDGNGSNQNIYAVPAGKTFYLYNVIGMEGSATNTEGMILLNDGTTIVTKFGCGATIGAAKAINSSVPIAVYTTGQNVVGKYSNGSRYGITGILVTN
jgi:hypothetical protein